MIALRVVVSGLMAMLVGTAACTPASLRYRQLAPVPAQGTTTLDELLRTADTTGHYRSDSSARRQAVVFTDSAMGTLAVFEYEDLLVLQIYLYNNADGPFGMDPVGITMMDGNRTAFRRLATHEAANIYASRVTGIPPYQPKYTYEFRSTTTGTLRAQGNMAYYNGQTSGSVTPVEDPYNALGYSIGAAIAQSRNAKYLNMASALYAIGLGQTSTIEGQTGGVGAVYFLKPPGWQRPAIVRFKASGYEVRFDSPSPGQE